MLAARRTATFTESVIRDMSRLAARHGAVNLAQGFPDFPAPSSLKEAAKRALDEDKNQYAITWGAKTFRDAIAAKHPLGLGSAEDLVGAYSYLASDASRWTTGSAIVVDGGYAAP